MPSLPRKTRHRANPRLPFFNEPDYRARRDRADRSMPSFSRPEEWLRWALKFAVEDLAALNGDARLERGDILRRLSPTMLRQEGWSSDYDFTSPIPDDRLLALQKELRNGLKALLQGQGTWNLPAPTGASVWRLNPEGKQAHFRMGWSGDDRIVFLHGVAALLTAYGAKIRACKQCGRPFLRRKRAEYCSPECGQRFRDQKKVLQKGGR